MSVLSSHHTVWLQSGAEPPHPERYALVERMATQLSHHRSRTLRRGGHNTPRLPR